MEKYHELTHTDGMPFVPNGIWKDAIFSGVILLAIAACALYFGPFGPSGQPDPANYSDRSSPRLLLPVALRSCSHCFHRHWKLRFC